MGEASRDLMRLRPVTFRYKKPFADGTKPTQYGLIAEEVDEVYPDLVAHSADGQIETVKYQVLPTMLNEVQANQHAQQQDGNVRRQHETWSWSSRNRSYGSRKSEASSAPCGTGLCCPSGTIATTAGR